MDTAVTTMLLRNGTKAASERKHETFAIEYMTDYDMIRAYKAVYDTEGVMDDMAAHKSAARLLNSVLVQSVIDRETCKYIADKHEEKEAIVHKLKRVYLEAMRYKDYSSANSALDKLMKHFGLYAVHNKQRKYGPEDIAAIRQKLEANGLQFDTPNKPMILQNVEEAESTPTENT